MSQVPVEVAINPTSGSFTTASGITVAAGTYKVVFTPVLGSPTTLSGALPAVPTGLYPSSWLTSSGIPQQLAFGWVGSTGSITDFHEVDAANVVSFTSTPQLAVTQTSYSAASPALGAPVTYTVSPSVSRLGRERELGGVGERDDAGRGDAGRRVRVGLDLRGAVRAGDHLHQQLHAVRGRHLPAADHAWRASSPRRG